ncbi:hypothetical protein [Aureivirga marina]|uniref:hypothetical protein n=1 Tax=Aureivirga marina TaxID=1182451 RepID=UPI0018C95211|nr:hypothetical protein [Aureivirga marina]
MNKHNKFDVFLIFFIAFYNLTMVLFSLLWLFTIVLDRFKIQIFGEPTSENIIIHFSYFFFAGVIGGSFYCLRALYQRLGEAYTPSVINSKDELSGPNIIFNVQVWLFWYIYRPFQGGILAVILVCLFNQGLIGLNGLKLESINSIFFQVGIGFLVGFGTHEVINKLEEIIKVLFAKSSKNSKSLKEKTQEKIDENEKIKK